VKRCHNCGAVWDHDRKPGFNELCPHCDAHLRCCLNCRLYDPHAASQCRSSTTEKVREKDRPSFCEEFEFAQRSGDEREERKKKADAARQKFDGLFKNP
jgi:hypothetical protein